MDMTNEQYIRYVEAKAAPSPLVKDLLWAFTVGGLICAGGQWLQNFYMALGLDKETAGTVVSMTLVFIAALLTGLGLFDKLAKHAGAGTLVPITGFSNAMASPAIEFKSENWVNGVGAKMFTVAGPVIVYGVSASVIYGIILVLLQSF